MLHRNVAYHIPVSNGGLAERRQKRVEMIMSTNTLDATVSFAPAVRPARPPRGIFAALRDVVEATRQGISAARRYQQLTARGMAPDQAARRVFDEHFAKA